MFIKTLQEYTSLVKKLEEVAKELSPHFNDHTPKVGYIHGKLLGFEHPGYNVAIRLTRRGLLSLFSKSQDLLYVDIIEGAVYLSQEFMDKKQFLHSTVHKYLPELFPVRPLPQEPYNGNVPPPGGPRLIEMD